MIVCWVALHQARACAQANGIEVSDETQPSNNNLSNKFKLFCIKKASRNLHNMSEPCMCYQNHARSLS